MGMRITNQMITGNSLRNMQKSMSQVNKYTTQMTTGKKITQASEDPVIAIRALKLRTTVNQLYQFQNKNIPDANSWLEITNTSLDNMGKRLTDLQTYCVQGSTDSFNSTDRSAIIDSLKELQDMLYSEGNSTYAGRYIFSGFKTDRALAFSETEDVTKYSYDITQHFTADDLDLKNAVLNGVDSSKINDYIAGTKTYNQPDPVQVYRLNLAYEGIEDVNNNGDYVLSLKAKAADGSNIDLTGFNMTVKSINDVDTYYDVNKNSINVIEETGEIVFGENVYNTLKKAADIEVVYCKDKFEAGDLRPEHYFDCTQYVVQTDGSIKTVDYEMPKEGQKIFYEVNFNQSIQVNTEGNQIIETSLSNRVNDLIYTLQDLQAAEANQAKLKDMLADEQYASNDNAVSIINQMLKDIDVEIAVKKENLQKTFSANIANFQDYMNKVTAMQSDLGSRMTKLSMIEVRVKEQYASFKELKSENEDVETDEAIIDFNQAELVYESALAATSKIMSRSLLDYL